ncbi:MAG: hypothetical protein ACJ8AO_08530 [Gemmatimonadaceae bacterium]
MLPSHLASALARRARLLVPAIVLPLVPGAVRAQAAATAAATADPTAAEARAALRSCADLAEGRRVAEAQAPAREAERLFRARVERQPRDVEALVGLARTLSQCLLPAGDLLQQGELSSQAIDLLERAIEIEPRHWVARFVLASIMFRSPSFLGRAPRAARELDTLLALGGDRADNPRLARAYDMRGTLWSRAGRADSARAVWERGLRSFPGDSLLRARVDAAPPASPAPPADAPPADAPAAATGLGAVRVVARASAPSGAQPSQRLVTRAQVLLAPGGGADVLQTVQLQPGATRVGEGADVYTRGGDPTETALLVNGARVPSLARFEGLAGSTFGALDPFVVQSVRFSSGGFSARHGDALSGVLEIETDGRPRERELRAGLSLVQASGTARAALGKKAGAWASARASNTAALLATHGRSAEFEGAPHSEDAMASVIAAPTPLTELRATALVERDDSRRIVAANDHEGPFHSRASSASLLLSSRWVSARAPVIVRASVAGTSRASAWDFGVLARSRGERSLRARVDGEWARSLALTLRGGAERGVLGREDRGTLPATASVAPGSPVRDASSGDARADHVGGYAEAALARGAALLTVGVRADRLPGEREATLDPRASLAVRRGVWTARVGGGVFHQGRWRAEAAIPDAGRPSGAPRAARHLVAGLEREGAASVVRVEAFRKRLSEYAPFGAGPLIASGSARGLDLIAQRTGAGPVTGWVGYSLLDADATLADGRRVRSPLDVTHSATASATAALGADWSVGATARYGTGAPHTPVVGGRAGDDGRLQPAYGPLMGERLPDYARLDARVMRYVRTPRWLLTGFLEAINLTGRANASAVAYDAAYRTRSLVPTFFASRTVVAGAEVRRR